VTANAALSFKIVHTCSFTFMFIFSRTIFEYNFKSNEQTESIKSLHLFEIKLFVLDYNTEWVGMTGV